MLLLLAIFSVGALKFALLDQFAKLHCFSAFANRAYSKKARTCIQAECDATEIFEDPKQDKDTVSAGVVEEDYRICLRMEIMLDEMRTSMACIAKMSSFASLSAVRHPAKCS